MGKRPKETSEGKRTADAELGEELQERTAWRAMYMRQMAHNRALATKIAKAIPVVQNAVRAFRRAAKAMDELSEVRSGSPFSAPTSAPAAAPTASAKPEENKLGVLARIVEQTILANLMKEKSDLRKPGQPRNIARWGLIANLERNFSEEQIAKKLIALGYDSGPLTKVTERVRVELNRISKDRQRVAEELRRIDNLMAGRGQDTSAMILLHAAMDLARADDHAGARSQLGDFRKNLPMVSPAIRSLLEEVEAMADGALRRREESARATHTPDGLGGLYSALAKFSLR